ncbi:MAG: hypothetical protein AB7E95_00445 [Kiritimatiellales bacterium]
MVKTVISRIFSILAFGVLASAVIKAEAALPDPTVSGQADIVYDFMKSFGKAVPYDALVATLDPGEKLGNVPNIYHHPGSGTSTLTFSHIALPEVSENGRLVFAFSAWSDRPVDIIPMINKTPVAYIPFNLQKVPRDPSPGWDNCVVDISRFAGQQVDFALGLRNHVQYRWAHPRIYALDGNLLSNPTLEAGSDQPIRNWNVIKSGPDPKITHDRDGMQIQVSSGETRLLSESVPVSGDRSLVFYRYRVPDQSSGSSVRFRLLLMPDSQAAAPVKTFEGDIPVSLRNGKWQEGYIEAEIPPEAKFMRFEAALSPKKDQSDTLVLERVQLVNVAPKLSIKDVSCSMVLPEVGEPFDVKAVIHHDGGSSIRAGQHVGITLDLPEGLVLSGGKQFAAQTVASLAENEDSEFHWTVSGIREQVARMGFRLTGESVSPVAAEQAIQIQPAGFRKNGTDISGSDAVLENDHLRLIIPRTAEGYSSGWVDFRKAGEWTRIGALPYLSYLVTEDPKDQRRHHDLIRADQFKLTSENDSKLLRLSGVSNESGAQLSVEFRLADGSDRLDMQYELRLSSGTKVSAWRGPVFLVGEGSFGAAKDGALFPGLEWLVDGERSSGTESFLPPGNIRLAPNSYKVTVPMMAVCHDQVLVSLVWDPLQKWDGEQITPTPFFSVPNWLESQNNSLMGLFVPSVAKYVSENELTAYYPYTVEGGRPLRIQSQLVVNEVHDGVADAVPTYLDTFGSPKIPEWNRDRLLERTREAYFHSHWVSPQKGWMRWLARDSVGFFPYILQSIWMDYMYYADADSEISSQLKDRLALGVEGQLKQRGWAGMGECAWQLGGISESLQAERKEVRQLMKTQSPEGGWGFDSAQHPGYGDEALLRGGSQGIGLTAIPAVRVLQYARITGDAETRAAGLKALEYMKKYTVPRAAQGWEVPIHAPDILASARACNAYLEGYRITGDQAYLDSARYWARTALPFIYTWKMPDVKVMQFGSIPVYGATHYIQSWLGTLVQWCGLEVAQSYARLSEYDSDPLWKRYSEGLLASGTEQQTKVGSLLDIWQVETARGGAVHIEPSLLMKTLAHHDGFPFEPRTVLLKADGKEIRLSSAEKIEVPQYEAGQLNFMLRYDQRREDGPAFALLVSDLAPETVRCGKRLLSQYDTVNDKEEGWSFDSATGFTVIKISGGKTADIAVHYNR